MFELNRWRAVPRALPMAVMGALFSAGCDHVPVPGDGGAGAAGVSGSAGVSGAAGAAGCVPVGGAAGTGATACGSVEVLRVDPDASPGGDGRTWATALDSLQGAIDQLAGRGGGEVWILGGEFERLTSAAEEFITLRSRVHVRGGFAGTETSPEQRDAGTPRTVLRTIGDTESDVIRRNLVQARDADDAKLERLALLLGAPALRVENCQRLLIEDVVMSTYSYFAYAVAVEATNSEVRFDHLQLELLNSAPYVVATNSDLSFVDLTCSNEIPLLTFTEVSSSRVLVQRATMDGCSIALTGSQALVIDSKFSGEFPPGGGPSIGYLTASTGDGTLTPMVTVVDSSFSGAVPVGTPVSAPSLFVWNSVFWELFGGPVRGSAPDAGSIKAPELEVALSTFYRNICSAPEYEGSGNACAEDVETGPEGVVHNSLFVLAQPEPGSWWNMTPRVAVTGTELLVGNCTTDASDGFQFIDGEPIAVNHPCHDAGDVAHLEGARQRLFTRTAPFRAPPFFADLSRYASPNWWREESAVLGQCVDRAAPDPGRHLDLACPPRTVP